MRRLHSLEAQEVSLVKRGANRKKFLVFKKRDLDPQALIQTVAKADPVVMARLEAVIKKTALDDGENARLSDAAQTALKAVGRLLVPFVNEITDADMDALQAALGIGAEGSAEDDDAAAFNGTDEPPTEVEMSDATTGGEAVDNDLEKADGQCNTMWKQDAPEGVDPKAHEAAMKLAKEAYDQALAKADDDTDAPFAAEKAEDAGEGDDAGDKEDEDKAVGKSAVHKSGGMVGKRTLSMEAISKAHAELTARNQELIAKSQKLESELRAERDIRVQKEFVAKADAYRGLGIDRVELAEVMKGFHDRGDAKGLEKLEGVLKAAHAQVMAADRHGLLAEMGSVLPAEGQGGAEAQLEALVSSRVAKSGNESRAKAMDAVLKTAEGRALYTRMQQERNKRA